MNTEYDDRAVSGAAQIVQVAAPELRSLLTIVTAALIVAALYMGRTVLVPITLAVMLSFVLAPVVVGLQRLRLKRAPAVIIAVFSAVGLVGVLAVVIATQAATLVDDAPRYARTIEAKAEKVHALTVARVQSITRNLDRRSDMAMGEAFGDEPMGTGAAAPTPVRIVEDRSSPLTIARTVLAPVLSPLETTIIVLVVAIFILMQREDLRDRFIRLFGSNDLHRTTQAMDDAGKRLSRYFLSQLAVNTGFGLVISAGLWFIGVPTPAMWGALAGTLRFVPYIGPLLGAVAPAALGAAVDAGWMMAIEVIALFLIVEPITGYVIEPLLYGHSTGLSPVSVIVSAIFWTWLWGSIGLVMSTPLTLILVVMGRHVKSLEFFDVLLGDRPALTPVESFYQRVLANNPDEALAAAEVLLTEQPLLSYYDDVVVPGLRLAAEDQARGAINRARETEMAQAVGAVTEELEEHAEPMAEIAAKVACIAGHGSFDEALAAIVAQMLRANGAKAIVLGNAVTSREAIGMVDLSGISVIAICHLELTGSPAKLRYLVKRLRAQNGSAEVVVGLWRQGEAALTDAALKVAIGADAYAASISDIVEAVATVRHGAERDHTKARIARA